MCPKEGWCIGCGEVRPWVHKCPLYDPESDSCADPESPTLRPHFQHCSTPACRFVDPKLLQRFESPEETLLVALKQFNDGHDAAMATAPAPGPFRGDPSTCLPHMPELNGHQMEQVYPKLTPREPKADWSAPKFEDSSPFFDFETGLDEQPETQLEQTNVQKNIQSDAQTNVQANVQINVQTPKVDCHHPAASQPQPAAPLPAAGPLGGAQDRARRDRVEGPEAMTLTRPRPPPKASASNDGSPSGNGLHRAAQSPAAQASSEPNVRQKRRRGTARAETPKRGLSAAATAPTTTAAAKQPQGPPSLQRARPSPGVQARPMDAGNRALMDRVLNPNRGDPSAGRANAYYPVPSPQVNAGGAALPGQAPANLEAQALQLRAQHYVPVGYARPPSGMRSNIDDFWESRTYPARVQPAAPAAPAAQFNGMAPYNNGFVQQGPSAMMPFSSDATALSSGIMGQQFQSTMPSSSSSSSSFNPVMPSYSSAPSFQAAMPTNDRIFRDHYQQGMFHPGGGHQPPNMLPQNGFPLDGFPQNPYMPSYPAGYAYSQAGSTYGQTGSAYGQTGSAYDQTGSAYGNQTPEAQRQAKRLKTNNGTQGKP
ncbi:hypothetical protein LX32DRAFT_732683 [Colletotrichum zoysiae]|uniref:Uncharacterized protein n=1 Tax=Colletotrichum zoysiae TaxID=1216348 RepID=A0AAD9H583_9PEZI|nr:hypothetical protein LX32DRAFT_732683 [Colletotrichum zoysiae]